MIDWEKAEYAKRAKVYLKTGEIFEGSGDGLYLAEDFDEPEEQYDSYFFNTKNKFLVLSVDDIKDVQILEM